MYLQPSPIMIRSDAREKAQKSGSSQARLTARPLPLRHGLAADVAMAAVNDWPVECTRPGVPEIGRG